MNKCTCLINRRGGDSHTETPAADGRDDLAGGVAAQDEAAGGRVLLHSPAE